MKVMVVDDNDDVRMFLTDALKHEGHKVENRSNPVHALDVIEDFDVLVTDYQMPEMPGTVLARRSKMKKSTLRVILVTATLLRDIEDQDAVDAIFSKPIFMCHLFDSVNGI